MSRAKRLFIRTLPAAFAAGTLFGVGITSLTAAFRGSAIFRDVPATHYADEAIGEMYQLGIIKGYDSAHFGPDDPLTRGQAAVLFKRLRDEVKGITQAVSTSSSAPRSMSSSSSSASSVSSATTSSSYNPGGSVRFDSNGYQVEKNVATGKLTFAVVRIGGNQGTGTVQYAVTGGTAVAGKDYAPISGTLTFGSKETSKKLTIQIFNNTASSGNKTVSLILSKPTGSVVLGTPNAVVLTIVDPASPTASSSASVSSAGAASTVLQLSAAAYGVAENGGSVLITVVRTGVLTTAVGATYSTSNGTATAGADYTATAGTLSFAAGETTKTFSVPVGDNNNIEGNRSFNVLLSSPTGGASLGTLSSPVTINDNEAGTMGSGSLKFSAATYTVTESQGTVNVLVNHVGGLGPVSVNYATSNGSAISGSDYTAASGTLSFAAGETSKIFTITVVKDALSESEETVNLTLSGPTNGVPLADPSTATLKIQE